MTQWLQVPSVRMNSIIATIFPVSTVSQPRGQKGVIMRTEFPTMSRLERLEWHQTSSCVAYGISEDTPQSLGGINRTGHVFAFQSADLALYHGPRLFLS